ncbi:MAG: hypothetical protein EBR00_09000 [Gammaproteobacteria bacterium]|nr:hypothetical protein [Gammaproteobacteria bacterium]
MQERAAQELDHREDHHVAGAVILAHDPIGTRQTLLDGASLARDPMHGLGERFRTERRAALGENLIGQQTAADTENVGFGVGLKLFNHPYDHGGLFRTTAKNGG